MYKMPWNISAIWGDIDTKIKDLGEIEFPDNMPCFKYHYPVKIPFTKRGSDEPILVESKYISTGTCYETQLEFDCVNGDTGKSIPNCKMIINRNINTTHSDNSTIHFEIKIFSATLATADLKAYAGKDDQLFMGTLKCHSSTIVTDIWPMKERCDVIMMVYGEENPFYFDKEKAPPKDS